MIRTTLDKAWLHRTIRLNYGWTQATPADMLLDPAWNRSVDIWPGMVAMKTAGRKCTLINATGIPYGFFGVYIGGDGVDEPLESGVNSIGVWVLDPDAEFEILSPAFDTGSSWVDPGDGTIKLVHAIVDGANRGKLAPSGQTGRGTLSAKPLCRLIEVDSATKIIVGGLSPADFSLT